ncbi:MAG: hypothetical protein M3472_08640 [Chloroflexota bacterium]|nr:hypothetical protein [Chloroflexota bacterium]
MRYQVKARRLTARNRSRQLGFIRGLDKEEDPFDLSASSRRALQVDGALSPSLS